MSCLARLCLDSAYEFSPGCAVYPVKLCKNKAEPGEVVCKEHLREEFRVYRKIGGKEFEARYCNGIFTLTHTPIAWSPSLPTIFETPTKYAKETYRAVNGLHTEPKINGWVTCYIKDKDGKAIKLQEVREKVHVNKPSYQGFQKNLSAGQIGVGSTGLGDRVENSTSYTLLTEPIPRYMYGGTWYEKQTDEYGFPPTSWIKMAEECQKEGEKRCLEQGHKPWVLKVVEEEMPKIPSKPEKNQKILEAKKIEPGVYYYEKAVIPQRVPTDSQKIWLEGYEGEEVWRAETGHIFKNDSGKPGKYITKIDS